jgi:hypothetical protein
LDETEWGATFTDRVESLLVESDRADYSARAWLSTLHITSGIVLEDDSRLQTGTEIFRAIIDDIHPNGYIKPAVGAENEEPGDGEGFIAQMRVVKALVLGAEAATHAGTDLWAYHQRGVSPLTAATYLMFYFHHPEHWPWDKDLTADFTMPLYRLHSGLWEMVARHSDHRLLKGLLDDLRPIFDPTGGALTTLTHARIKKRRFGLF